MSSVSGNLYQFGEFCLDPQSRLLKRGAAVIALSPKAFDVLLLLIQHTGELVTKDELMRTVWSDSFVEESNLTQTVFMLRKALGETPERKFIVTVQGRGYRFVAQLTEPATTDSPSIRSGDGIPFRGQTGPVTFVAGSNAPAPSANPRSKKWTLLVVAAVAAVAVAVASAAYFEWSRRQEKRAPAGTRVMLAVLPFQNLTGDPSQEYVSDGLTEEMITDLGNLDTRQIGVIARTSVMHYKNSQVALDQIGRELNVQYVVEGSVRRDNNSVRVTAQLIATKDQTHVWAREYDRELTGLLSLQREIAKEIADEIQLTFGARGARYVQPATSPQENAAYDLYLKGQFFLSRRTVADLQEAIAQFQRALARDPSYAKAYAGLADAYILLSAYSTRPQKAFISKARAAALQALQLDDSLAEAHTALALIVQNYDWDWQTAEREFRRAIDLNPNYATAHHWYAEHLAWRGRFEEAFRESESARRLDPLSMIVAADNGAIFFFARRYDEAIVKWRSVQEMDPYMLRTHLIAGAYVEKQMFAEAMAETEKFRPRISPASYWSWRAYIQARAGRLDDARHSLDVLLKINHDSNVDPIVIAYPYAALGDKDHAFAYLDQAYAVHSGELISLKVSPLFDPLRDDPRFGLLLKSTRNE